MEKAKSDTQTHNNNDIFLHQSEHFLWLHIVVR